jgi:hypothetical protein
MAVLLMLFGEWKRRKKEKKTGSDRLRTMTLDYAQKTIIRRKKKKKRRWRKKDGIQKTTNTPLETVDQSVETKSHVSSQYHKRSFHNQLTIYLTMISIKQILSKNNILYLKRLSMTSEKNKYLSFSTYMYDLNEQYTHVD